MVIFALPIKQISMALQHLPIEKVQELEESTGWLSNYIGSEDPENVYHHIGPELGNVDWKRTLLLARLADLNRQRAIVIDELMKSPVTDSVVDDPSLPVVITWITGSPGVEDYPEQWIDSCAKLAFGAAKKSGLLTDDHLQYTNEEIDTVATMNDFLESLNGAQIQIIIDHLTI